MGSHSRSGSTRGFWVGAATVLLFSALIGPFPLWWGKSRQVLEVRILDKTVADASMREHKGLVWLLNHDRWVKPDGQDYRADTDYQGFFPLPDHQWRVVEPPLEGPVDLTYIADTYGVYAEEFYGENLGNRSRKLHGGLTLEEVKGLEKSLARGGTLVAEFNTFASPTALDARTAMGELLGLRWSGWIARFFVDLDRNEEMPPWAVSNWEKQTGKTWAFRGPGLLFASDADEIVVLEEGRQVDPGGACRLAFLAAGTQRFDLVGSYRYNYWFDVIEPLAGTEILAEYRLGLRPQGIKALAARGIPATFPALLARRRGDAPVYYFAGDFVDSPALPRIHRILGLPTFMGWVSEEGPRRNDRFFWRAYIPMMRRILDEAAERRKLRVG